MAICYFVDRNFLVCSIIFIIPMFYQNNLRLFAMDSCFLKCSRFTFIYIIEWWLSTIIIHTIVIVEVLRLLLLYLKTLFKNQSHILIFLRFFSHDSQVLLKVLFLSNHFLLHSIKFVTKFVLHFLKYKFLTFIYCRVWCSWWSKRCN